MNESFRDFHKTICFFQGRLNLVFVQFVFRVASGAMYSRSGVAASSARSLSSGAGTFREPSEGLIEKVVTFTRSRVPRSVATYV